MMKSTTSPRTISILFLSAICVIASATTSSHRSSKNTKRQYDGIGVSHHQRQIDWREVTKDKQVKFVYIKITQGTSTKDKNYEQSAKAAHHQGLCCDFHHYLSCLASVRFQFRNFQEAMRGHKQDLAPTIDMEHDGVRRQSKKQVQDSIALFAELIERKYGKKPLTYSHIGFYNSRLSPRFNKYFLSLSRYNSVRPPIRGVGRYNIWQFSDRGKIHGIRDYVDLDRFMLGMPLTAIRLQ